MLVIAEFYSKTYFIGVDEIKIGSERRRKKAERLAFYVFSGCFCRRLTSLR